MRDETPTTPETERTLDELLERTFPGSPALSGDFESRVMSAVGRERRSRRSRLILVTMMAYWAIAGLFGAMLLSGVMPAEDRTGAQLGVVLCVLALVGAAALVMVRQAGFRLSELFLRTVID